MRSLSISPIWIFVLVLVLSSQSMALLYEGDLSSSDTEILGTGSWITPGTTDIQWVVTKEPGTAWHYWYQLSVPSADNDISHFILETPDIFTKNDVFNTAGAFESMEIKLHLGNSPGSPGQPDDVYGIKFDSTQGTILTISFDTWRAPVWGDFYAKGGGNPSKQLWNQGFVVIDPAIVASNGSIDNHILVPGVIPEPASLLILGLGSLFLRAKHGF